MNIYRTLLIAVLLATCTGCDGGIWVHAKIVDPAGKPIQGATARLWFKDYQDKFDDSSNSNGCIDLGGTIAPMREQWDVAIDATGYKPLRTAVISAERHTLLVVMQPVDSAQESSYKTTDRNDGCPL
jgi:hypothetical protein